MLRAGTAEKDSAINIAFLFTGQGSQHPRMGQPFYDRHPEFRTVLYECDRLFRAPLGVSMAELLLDAGSEELLEQTAYQQPALFAFEYALARLWISHGIVPDVVLGHSIGEIVATTVAGCLDLADAVRLVATRGCLMQRVDRPGAMLAVAAGTDQTQPVLDAVRATCHDAVLSFAAINAPDRCVVSGGPESIDAAAMLLWANKIPSTRLKVSHAFHSPLMAAAAAALGKFTTTLRFREPRTALVSALDGAEPDAAALGDPRHWIRHCLDPVDFAAAVRTVAARGPHAFIEIGPSHTLLKFAQRCTQRSEHRWFRSAAPNDTDCRQFAAALDGCAGDEPTQIVQ